MPFRKVQVLRLAGYVPVMEPKEVIQPNGNIDYQLENRSAVKLPDAELFDITNQLSAGVSLEEVNSKVLAHKSVKAVDVVRKYTKQETSNNGDE